MEEDATGSRLILLYSCSGISTSLQGVRLLGYGEVNSSIIKPLLRVSRFRTRTLACVLTTPNPSQVGANYASKLRKALETRMQTQKLK